MSLVKGGVTHAAVCTTCFQTECEVLFQPSLFSPEDYFFPPPESPNALAICWKGRRLPARTTEPSVVDAARLPPLPPFTPAALSPVGPQTSLCEGHRLHRRDPGLAGPLPHHPSPRHNPNTFRSHPPHTAPLCAPNLRPAHPHLHQKKKEKDSPAPLAVWPLLGAQAATY